jgi:hypothetical protein
MTIDNMEEGGWLTSSFEIKSRLLGLWEAALLCVHPGLSLVKIIRQAKTQLAHRS